MLYGFCIQLDKNKRQLYTYIHAYRERYEKNNCQIARQKTEREIYTNTYSVQFLHPFYFYASMGYHIQTYAL